MKHFIVLFLSTFLVFNCSEDQSSEEEKVNYVWKLTEWSLKESIDLNNDGEATSSFVPGCLNGSRIYFSDSENASVFISSDVTFYQDHESLDYAMSCSTSSDRPAVEITYSKNGDEIILNTPDGIFNGYFEGNDLLVEIPEGFEVFDNVTFETVLTMDLTLKFSKE